MEATNMLLVVSGGDGRETKGLYGYGAAYLIKGTSFPGERG